MTSTICPSPSIPCSDLSNSTSLGKGLFGVGRRVVAIADQIRRHAERFWGSGSETPSSVALDSVDVPRFDR